MAKEHADFRRLLQAMKAAAALARPWRGVAFRSAPPKWAAGREMLTGIGSMKSGARFNAPDSFPAVYRSTTPELAMIESLAYQRRAGVPIELAMPLVFKALSVDVQRSLDFSDIAALRTLGIATDQIRLEKWWLARACGEESLTQAIGRAACSCGVQTILAPSAHATHQGLNVIIFPDNLEPPSELKVLRRHLSR
jgi:RES domain-containing protein